MTNKLIVITGATGTGKTTVSDYLKEKYKIVPVITHTTRPPRFNEESGVDYYFENDQSFDDNHYLERVKYSNYQYGSSYEGLRKAWKVNPIASIVLDTQGAITYAEKLTDEVEIWFLKVSDERVLRERLIHRGDKIESIDRRMQSPEYRRDLVLPEQLQQTAQVISSESWPETKKQVDLLVGKLQEQLV